MRDNFAHFLLMCTLESGVVVISIVQVSEVLRFPRYRICKGAKIIHSVKTVVCVTSSKSSRSKLLDYQAIVMLLVI